MLQPEFAVLAAQGVQLAGELGLRLLTGETDRFEADFARYERTAAISIGAFHDTPANRRALTDLAEAHRVLLALIDGEVDRLAREMAGRRRGRRLAGSYLTADASIERQTRSA